MSTDAEIFEKWVIATHPGLFRQWKRETDGAVILSLWMWDHHYKVIEEWNMEDIDAS